jgi:hypothetical protein
VKDVDINESSLSRVSRHIQGRNIGMISAQRIGFSEKENRERNRKLESDIRAAGHGFVHVKGRSMEGGIPTDEHSYLVVGTTGEDKGELKSFLIKHGHKYDQDAVFHKASNELHAFLHGLKPESNPPLGQTKDMGDFRPNRAGQYHSLMSGPHSKGRTFAFESFQFFNATGFFSRKQLLF